MPLKAILNTVTLVVYIQKGQYKKISITFQTLFLTAGYLSERTLQFKFNLIYHFFFPLEKTQRLCVQISYSKPEHINLASTFIYRYASYIS